MPLLGSTAQQAQRSKRLKPENQDSPDPEPGLTGRGFRTTCRVSTAYEHRLPAQAGGLLLSCPKKRLQKRMSKAKALSALAHKIGRATYFMLKNKTVFDEQRFLS